FTDAFYGWNALRIGYKKSNLRQGTTVRFSSALGTVLEPNLACSGGMATDTLLALCQYCGVSYGELDPNVHYDMLMKIHGSFR
ncbi:MAG: hypothetical protein U0M60_12090, partial [Clostridia bacterium]|nr:hypothetical protein [Clostridia bacterium]